jgi:uncharacterized RDD family membrane protein YckC
MTSTIAPADSTPPAPEGRRASTWGPWIRRGLAFLLDISAITSVTDMMDNSITRPIAPGVLSLVHGALVFVYWAASEALTPGKTTLFKWLFRLRVVSGDGTRPRVAQILSRAAVIAVLFGLNWTDVIALLAGGRAPAALAPLGAGVMMAFVAHTVVVSLLNRESPLLPDLLSGTRVVARGVLPAALPDRVERLGPRLAIALTAFATACALVVGMWGAHGPELRRLWTAPADQGDLARLLERQVAKQLNLRSSATITGETHWATGKPKVRIVVIALSLPWSAASDENVRRCAGVVLDTLRVDPRVWNRFELHVRSKQQGLLQLSKDAKWTFGFDSTANKWREVESTASLPE